ncbi:MAG TPA: dihydrodipicolinate reductase [Verrucomicrobiae bacterium]|nr:dihydrodipicolinate reductase [Verrucomicrobiae bacterium]
MNEHLKVAQMGLGPIGLECLKALAEAPWAQVVGAVDIDPAKCGADLAVLIGQKALRGLRVCASPEELKQSPEIIFHTAVSRFKDAYEQLEALARRGINVVSSCEELVFPSLRQPRLAQRLDALCRKTGARVVGTGVNPGFVMDVLPVCLGGVVRDIRAIQVERIVDASTRREPLQRKIGSGQPPAQFRRLLRSGRAGHAGLAESLALIAHALNWKTVRIVESANPVVAKRNIRTRYFSVIKGQTCGLHQRVVATTATGCRILLDLKMYLGAENPRDIVRIKGNPPLDLVMQGGVAGDQATVAALVNTARRLMKAPPGLALLTDLPMA